MEKDQQILSAAKSRFMRYGFAKTTMGDIAEEAEVSRQTLYNAYSSKEEIMRRVVRNAGQETQSAVEAAWATSDDLTTRLTQFHDMVPVKWYVELHQSPDWAELMEGMHKAARDEVDVVDKRWKEALHQMFKNSISDRSEADIFDIVDFFYNASLNAKHGAQDVDHLRRRLTTIRKATLALL